MAKARDDTSFEQLAQRVYPGSKLVRTWELKGGVSAQVTALEVERPDGFTKTLVLRRHGDADLKQNPHIAADEFKLLGILRSAGLPAPVPCYLDESGELFPKPYIVLEYIQGKPELAPADLAGCLAQLAAHLANIHRLDPSSLDLSFLPDQDTICAEKLRQRPAIVDESLGEGRIRDVLEPAWPWPRRNKTVLLHGDYWPGNILWEGGRLVGIIDWEDARLGDPLADLANTRLEILWAFGVEAMQSFTRQYASPAAIDLTNLPYWDLCAALRTAFKIAEWAGDEATEKRMRERHRLFIEQAFERLIDSP